MSEVELVQVLGDWYRSERDSLEARGLSVRFGQSPAERSKTSAWLAAERSGRMAHLQVWSTGELEFEAGSENRIDVQEHYEISSAAELAAVLERFLGFLERGEP